MRNLDWNEGAPGELVPGMALHIVGGGMDRIMIIGHTDAAGQSSLNDPDARGVVSEDYREYVKRWAYIIQPYQLEWLESMNKQHGKGNK